MPIDINGYSDAFRAFTDFAEKSIEAGKGKAVARVGTEVNGAGPLEGRTITAAKRDWVGIGIGRLKSLKDANNVARDLFRKAVVDMFGGETRIPTSVLDAMKMSDYGKGKPLTARRIMAVQQAVADAMQKTGAMVSELKTTVLANAYNDKSPEFKEKLDKNLETVLSASIGDDDLVGLLKYGNTLRNLTMSGGEPRTVESAEAKIASLKDNLAELRAATKGNRAMYQAGLRALAMFQGGRIDKGYITAMVRCAKAAKIDAIRRLNGTSTMSDVHLAVLQCYEKTSAIMTETKALKALDKSYGLEEVTAMRNFIGSLMLSRLPQNTLRAMNDVFKSETSGKVNRLYHDLSQGKILLDDAEEELVDLTKINFTRIIGTMSQMSASVSEALGEKPEELPKYKGKSDEEMADIAAGMYGDVEDVAREEFDGMAEAKRGKFVEYVEGEGV